MNCDLNEKKPLCEEFAVLPKSAGTLATQERHNEGLDIDTYEDDDLDSFMPSWYRVLATFAIGTLVLLIFLGLHA